MWASAWHVCQPLLIPDLPASHYRPHTPSPTLPRPTPALPCVQTSWMCPEGGDGAGGASEDEWDEFLDPATGRVYVGRGDHYSVLANTATTRSYSQLDDINVHHALTAAATAAALTTTTTHRKPMASLAHVHLMITVPFQRTSSGTIATKRRRW